MYTSSGIQWNGILVYLKRYMGEQIKLSLISAQINQEPGVKMILLEITFASKKVAAGATESEG